MTEMRDNGTVAFIGPDDTCRSEALVAAAWNLPMISYVSYVLSGILASIHEHACVRQAAYINGGAFCNKCVMT
jgi:hypothetical protein